MSAKQFARAYHAGNFVEAEKRALALVARDRRKAMAWQGLGAARLNQRRPQEARQALETSLGYDADNAQTLYLLGKCQLALNHWRAAVTRLSQAARLRPDHAYTQVQLAEAWQTLNDHEAAVVCIDRAWDLDNSNADILYRRIKIRGRARRMDGLLADCRRLIALRSNNPDYHNLVGSTYNDQGHFEQAEHHYREALRLDPQHAVAFSNRIFNAHYNPALSRAHILDLVLQWRDTFEPRPRPSRQRASNRDEGRPLTIGLLSSGLRSHPVGQMITAALEHLSADDFQLIAYATSNTEDHISARLRRISHRWHSVATARRDTLNSLIRDDQVDILIDLNGHADGNRLRLLADEPAPLLVKWVGGLVNTTGLEAIDYLISDSVETPAGYDDQYLEKLIRMPDDYICYQPPRYAPAVEALPALRNGYVTFGCLNNPAKINPRLIDEWVRLMEEVPQSRLLLKGAQYGDADFRETLHEQFERRGIVRQRVRLEGPENHTAFLDTYNRIDIALDPWPYSGGLTTCEALLMGVPVITLPGPTFAGRHAASHLVNAGLPELVVDSWDAYRARARDLAGDLDNLATVRRHLRDTLMQSPVCDAPRFAAHLSAALRGIWQRYCRDLPPAALTFSQDGTGHFEDQALPVPEPILPSVTLAKAAARRENAGRFQFDFSGKIVALDNGGQLLATGAADSLLPLGAFELLVFDPLGEHAAQADGQRNGLQVFPQTTLGDGNPAVHYACLDPAFSATLPPAEGAGQGARVLTELPVNTVTLDSIEGLPSLDWLVLDHRNDSLATLRNGARALEQTLLIQATVCFGPGPENQPDLAGLCQWAGEHGFRLYRLDPVRHHSHLPEHLGPQRQASELRTAKALLLPVPSRLAELDHNRKTRLAFLLHTVYGIQDLAYALLSEVDETQAARYLADLNGDAPSPRTPDIPDAPFMSEAEKALFKKSLERAGRYFEFGSGGSTVWACQAGLTVHGVESDAAWVDGLKQRLGEACQVHAEDIGPTKEWGFPVSDAARHRFPAYGEAIHRHDQAFDLILVDGRFRVACVLNAIRHTLNVADRPGDTRLFIHDFWNRPHYHAVLEFLVEEESAETAGVFRIAENIDPERMDAVLEAYRFQPA
ncbi:O-linked N-acetylglucosamine transferase, SPINDLY family protein [Alloalcanivorax venustensis]|uniref:O-linked N-acetylglucosamine transferase, SPINDLY family protein n=1 Tax=Alloalcanivorax venustensis TaxID=172371 RepID=UPI003519A0B0